VGLSRPNWLGAQSYPRRRLSRQANHSIQNTADLEKPHTAQCVRHHGCGAVRERTSCRRGTGRRSPPAWTPRPLHRQQQPTSTYEYAKIHGLHNEELHRSPERVHPVSAQRAATSRRTLLTHITECPKGHRHLPRRHCRSIRVCLRFRVARPRHAHQHPRARAGIQPHRAPTHQTEHDQRAPGARCIATRPRAGQRRESGTT
jgi:hypothetical protein